MKNINQILKENFTQDEIANIETEAAKRAQEYMVLKQVVLTSAFFTKLKNAIPYKIRRTEI